MAIRKKTAEMTRRNAIIDTAEELFKEKGIKGVTIGEIAEKSKYDSKIIFNYFKNKDEIVESIVLRAIKIFQEKINECSKNEDDYYEYYYSICNSIAEFYEKYPLYGKLLKDNIIKPNNKKAEIYKIIEEINNKIGEYIQEGIQNKLVRDDLGIYPILCFIWSTVFGIVEMSEARKTYLYRTIEMTKEEFLLFSFESLLNTLR